MISDGDRSIVSSAAESGDGCTATCQLEAERSITELGQIAVQRLRAARNRDVVVDLDLARDARHRIRRCGSARRVDATFPPRHTRHRCAKDLTTKRTAQLTTWLYGIGEPINFYCHSSCVLDIYESADHLPQKFVLLYRPKNSREAKEYLDLQSHGFVTDESTYYTDGAKNPSGTTAATMERAPANQ